MSLFGDYFAGYFGDYFGGAGAAVGPDGDLIAFEVEDGATLTYAWRTDVQEALTGNEQRFGGLDRPRQRYEFRLPLRDDEYRSVQAFLQSQFAISPIFNLALAYEDLPILDATATALTVDTLDYCDWKGDGQRICVVSDAGTLTGVIVGASANVLTVDTDFTSLVARHDARVMPLMPVTLDSQQTFDRYRVNLGGWALKATARAFSFPNMTEVGVGATVEIFEGIPVWTVGIQGEQRSEDSIGGADVYDLGTVLTIEQRLELAKGNRELAIEGSSLADFQWFKRFLNTINGARVAFLRPTGRPDLVAIGDASSGTLTIDATRVDYLNKVYPSLAHRRLHIVLADGTSHFRSVESVEDDDDRQDLVLSSALVGAIDRVEYLETCRLEAGTDGVTEVSIGWEGATFSSVVKAKVVQEYSSGAFISITPVLLHEVSGVDTPVPGDNVNITDQGRRDWFVPGADAPPSAPSSYRKKASGTGELLDGFAWTVTGSPTLSAGNTSHTDGEGDGPKFSCDASDGTPADITNYRSNPGMFGTLFPPGWGFTQTCVASTNKRTLRLWFLHYFAECRIDVSLSDGSSPSQSITLDGTPTTRQMRVDIDFAAASEATLNVAVYLTEMYGTGNEFGGCAFRFHGAALSERGTP